MSTSFRDLPETMLAVRKLKSEPGLWLQEGTPVPKIGPRDALIAVTHTGICGTDRHIYEWDAWSRGRVKLGITTRALRGPSAEGGGRRSQRTTPTVMNTPAVMNTPVAMSAFVPARLARRTPSDEHRGSSVGHCARASSHCELAFSASTVPAPMPTSPMTPEAIASGT